MSGEGYGAWDKGRGKRENSNSCFSVITFAFHAASSFRVTGDFDCKLSIKITKLKQQYKKKANSVLKKHGSSLSAPGAKR